MNEEAKKENQKLLAEAIERKRKLTELKENPNFEFFCQELKTQLDRRYVDVIGFPSKLDKIVQNTYTCGEIAGIKLALEFADNLIEHAQATIDMEKAMQEQEKEMVDELDTIVDAELPYDPYLSEGT